MTEFQELVPVKGLSDEDAATFSRLLGVHRKKRRKNLLLDVYSDGHRAFEDLGISVPPQMSMTRAALDWPAKAVRSLTRKHDFLGFSLDGDSDPFGVAELLAKNQFDIELLQGISATYKHSFSLLSSVRGNVADGDPEVIVRAHDALWSAGIWDSRRNEVGAAIVVGAAADDSSPVDCTLFLRHETYRVAKDSGRWVAEALGNGTGRTLVELLPHDPQIGRPFGRSRITREVRYLTDMAIRTLVRGEASAEFFASPQRYVLGADESAFDGENRWSVVTGRVLAISNNEEGDTPSVGQFPQMTMSPHWEMYRQLAQNFCAATSLPQSAVGIYADNPASAEAMQAAEAQLSEDAEYQWKLFCPALLRLHQNMLMLRGDVSNVSALTADHWRVNVNYTPARYVSPQAASDFAVKAVSADPQLAGTTVLRRRLGLSQGEIDEVRAEARRSSVSQLADRLRGGVSVGNVDGAGAPPAVDSVEVAG